MSITSPQKWFDPINLLQKEEYHAKVERSGIRLEMVQGCISEKVHKACVAFEKNLHCQAAGNILLDPPLRVEDRDFEGCAKDLRNFVESIPCYKSESQLYALRYREARSFCHRNDTFRFNLFDDYSSDALARSLIAAYAYLTGKYLELLLAHERTGESTPSPVPSDFIMPNHEKAWCNVCHFAIESEKKTGAKFIDKWFERLQRMCAGASIILKFIRDPAEVDSLITAHFLPHSLAKGLFTAKKPSELLGLGKYDPFDLGTWTTKDDISFPSPHGMCGSDSDTSDSEHSESSDTPLLPGRAKEKNRISKYLLNFTSMASTGKADKSPKTNSKFDKSGLKELPDNPPDHGEFRNDANTEHSQHDSKSRKGH